MGSVCFVLSKEFTTTCPETKIPKLQCGYSFRTEAVPLREMPVFTQITCKDRQRQLSITACGRLAAESFTYTLSQQQRRGNRVVRVVFYLCRCGKSSMASFRLVS